MAKWVCKFCIAQHGLLGSQLNEWPDAGDVEAMARHLEDVHGLAVARDDETMEEARARLAKRRQ